jgi:hypothetical protein
VTDLLQSLAIVILAIGGVVNALHIRSVAKRNRELDL